MIKIGNILIDYDSIDTVLKTVPADRERGVEYIQVIYKSGVVKNIKSYELGMGCNEFIETLEKEHAKEADKQLLKLMAMFNNKANQ